MKNIGLILHLSFWACLAAGSSSFALEAGDTMGSWKSASAEEKRKVVASLLKMDGAGPAVAKVVECMDAASAVSGHADLSIGDVAKACEADRGQPV